MALGDPKTKDDYFTRLRSRLSTGDMIYGLGTLAIALANPDGVQGQADVMEEALEMSKTLGANLAKNTVSTVNSKTIPRLKEIEKEKNELDQWYRSSMIDGEGMAVRKPFVKALVESGQWRLFAQALAKEEAALAKATGSDSYKLSAAEIEGMFPQAETILRNYADQDWETFEETEGKTFRDYLDTQFSGYKEIIDASENASQAKTGLLASFYNPSAGALQEQAKLMRVMPPQTIDGTTFTMQQLAELSQAGYLGQNPEDFIPIPGSYDLSRNDPNLFVENVQDKLSDSITNSFLTFTDTESSNMFSPNGDYSQAGGYYDGDYLPWDGDMATLDKTIEVGRNAQDGTPQKKAADSAQRLKNKFQGNLSLQLLVESNYANFILDKQVDENGDKMFTPIKIMQLQAEHRDKITSGEFEERDRNLFTVHEGFVENPSPGSSMISLQDVVTHGQSFATSMINNIKQYVEGELGSITKATASSKLIIKRELPIDGRVFANIDSVRDFLSLLNIDPERGSYNGFRPTDTITFLHPASESGKSVLVSATLSQLTDEGMDQFIRRN